MADATTLRELALKIYQYADEVVGACTWRPPCQRCWTIAWTYRSLAGDFHQRALQGDPGVSRYNPDEIGAPVCAGCVPGEHYPCEASWCQCLCRIDVEASLETWEYAERERWAE